MSFEGIRGQDPALGVLRHALETGRLHHAYRFEGPDGVGKERAALALAAELVAEPGPAGADARRRVFARAPDGPDVPLHPDVIVLQTGLYNEVLDKKETNGIGVLQVRRLVLDRMGMPPHEGRRRAVIVRDADELTVEAANALLKTLEEPDRFTHFVLLTSRPRRLLDTIRSRTLAVRFAPLSDELVAEILRERGLPDTAAPLSDGSASLALELADEEAAAARAAVVDAILAAADAPSIGASIELGDRKEIGRDGLELQLAAVAQALVRQARAALPHSPARAELAARRYREVRAALADLGRNGNPTLVLEALMARLRRAAGLV